MIFSYFFIKMKRESCSRLCSKNYANFLLMVSNSLIVHINELCLCLVSWWNVCKSTPSWLDEGGRSKPRSTTTGSTLRLPLFRSKLCFGGATGTDFQLELDESAKTLMDESKRCRSVCCWRCARVSLEFKVATASTASWYFALDWSWAEVGVGL